MNVVPMYCYVIDDGMVGVVKHAMEGSQGMVRQVHLAIESSGPYRRHRSLKEGVRGRQRD